MSKIVDAATKPPKKYMDEYKRWCARHAADFLPMLDGPLYHYTAGSGLIEIIKSGELWSTRAACLNDSSEMLYPIELLRRKVRERLESSVTREIGFLLKELDARLIEPTMGTRGPFVACFSEDGDDLSQWRAYGGGEGGYAIQFDFQHLRNLCGVAMSLGKVEYDVTSQNLFFEDLLEHMTRVFLNGMKAERAPNMKDWASEFLRTG
jgi:hypothetical protein